MSKRPRKRKPVTPSAEPIFSLAPHAGEFFQRFVADHAGAPLTIVNLARALYRLGDVDDAKLAHFRTALRRARKFLDNAIEIADGHADDHRKKMQALRARDADHPPPAAAGEGDRQSDGGGGVQ